MYNLPLTVSCHLYGHVVQAGVNAMHMAAEGGQVEMLKFLSLLFDVRVHEKNSYGWTSLHHAAHSGHCQVARYLIEELKIDPNDKNTVCGVLERRVCGHSAASVYMLIVANTSMYIHVMCRMVSLCDMLNLSPCQVEFGDCIAKQCCV